MLRPIVHTSTRINAVSASVTAALLGLGGAHALAQSTLPTLPAVAVEASSEVAQSAIHALANIAANAGNNEALVQAAIAAIANIALQSINTPPLYHQPQPLLSSSLAGQPVPAVSTRQLPVAQASQVIEMAEPEMAEPEVVMEVAVPEAARIEGSTAERPSASRAEDAQAEVMAGVATKAAVSDAAAPEVLASEEGTSRAFAPEAAPSPPPVALAAPVHALAARTENDAIEEALEVQVSTLVQDTPLAQDFVPNVLDAVAAVQIETPEVAGMAEGAEAGEPLASPLEPVAAVDILESATPARLSSLAASLTDGVMKEARARPALVEDLILPPRTVAVQTQAPVVSVQAEAPVREATSAAQAEVPEEVQEAVQENVQEDVRPIVFMAATDTTPRTASSVQPAPLPAPVPGQPPAVPVVPSRPQPVAIVKAEDDTDSGKGTNKDIDTRRTDAEDANTGSNTASLPVLPLSKAGDAAAAASTAGAPAGPAAVATTATPKKVSGKYRFNTNLLVFPVDMDMYADGENPVLPGTYRLDVYLNDSWAGKFDVRFANLNPDDRIAQPCFDAGMLDALGFDPQHYAPGMKARLDAGESICGHLSQIVDGAGSSFNDGEHKLMLTAPQVVLVRVPRGYVDPKRWDAGITAATLGYTYNAYSSKQGGSFPGGTQTSHYLGLRSSLNLGDWRVRFRSTFNKSARRDLTHRRDSLYVERGVPSLKSRLVIGESATSGHVFDSISILGAQLVSDTRMRPDSQNAFVPIIRGIAQSNAKVTVHQRGEQVYEMTVPPGPFIIDDLYPNGTGGDLLVTITEADGTQRTFIETYANLPEMLRPGTMHYSASVGRYRNRMFEEEPVMGMLTGSYGFNNTVTGYGGVMLAAGYHSASIGAGFNLPVGAVSADATWANTRADTTGGGITSNGYAFRVGWTKFMPKVDTDVTLAMYRYATKGFYEPAQAFQFRETLARGGSQASFRPWGNVRRNQLALRLSHQPRGKWGAMSFGASVQDYWDRQGRDVSYHLGWGRSIGSASLGLTVNRSRNVGANRWENQYMLTLSMPLGRSTGNPVYTNTSLSKRRNSISGQTSVSGTLGERHQVGWSLFASGNKSKNSDLHKNGGGSMSATTAINRMGASYSASSGGSRQTSVSTSGAMVAFKGGVILSPELGETIGLVQAKNAVGARVQGARASSLNAKGHAVVPYLRPYRENNIHLDPKGLSTDVELGSTSQKVAPTDGAVVLLNYETRQGWAMLVSGKRADGSALPFAAGVLNEDGRNVGYVAQGGQALIRADAPTGALTVRWGPLQDQRCNFDYDLSGDKFNLDATGFRRVEVICK